MSQQNSKKDQYKKWLTLINIPIQMGLAVYLASIIGQFFDNRYKTENEIYTKGFVLLGISLAFYMIIKQLEQLNKNQKN